MKILKGRYESSIRARCFLLTCYLTFVLTSQILVSTNFRLVYLIIGFILSITLSLTVSPVLIKEASKIMIRENAVPSTMRLSRWGYYVFPFSVMFICYIAYYPGCFSFDQITQYAQTITNTYNDWHPALHTLIVFKLPLLLSRGWEGSIVFVQIICFSLALGYCFRTLSLFTDTRLVLGFMILILCNPLTQNIAMYPMKDTSFAIGAVVLLTFSLRIFMSDGKWLVSKKNAAIFIAVTVITTLFRHNAFLFTIPLLFAVMTLISPKRGTVLLLSVLLMFGGIKGPLYSMLHVEKADNRQVEILGLPLNIIGATVMYTPEKVDSDIIDFVYRVAPEDAWQTFFIPGSINQLKFEDVSNENVIEQYGFAKILDMMRRCIIKSPIVSIQTVIKLTEGIYTLTDPHPDKILTGTVSNDIDIIYTDETPLRSVLVSFQSFIYDFFPHVFLYYGYLHLIMIIVILAKTAFHDKRDIRRLLFVLPVFIYNLGTAVLMTGNDDSPRFFYYTVLLFPVVLTFFYHYHEETPQTI